MRFSSTHTSGARTMAFALGGMLVALFAGNADAAQTGSIAEPVLLDAGDSHTCTLVENRLLFVPAESRRLYCWGDNARGQTSTSPEGQYMAVSSGFDHSCALRADGEIACWGEPGSTATPPPAGPFIAVSAGYGETCALRADGELACWGGALAAAAPKSGPFIAIDIADGRGCAIRADGKLDCWKAHGVSSLSAEPQGRFLAVDVAGRHACALRSDGEVHCWGPPNGHHRSPVSSLRFVAIAIGEDYGCGIRDNGEIACWGQNHSGQLDPPAGRFTAITAGREHLCARGDDGAIQCWGGANAHQELEPAYYNFSTVAVGPDLACGTGAFGGEIRCSEDQNSALTPALGRYTAISFGANTACGLGVNGEPQCWGASIGDAPEEPLTTISVGAAHACGLRPNGTAVCWGDNSASQTTPPPVEAYESFWTIASGDRFSCGLSNYSGLMCWGEGEVVANAPQGLFAALSVHGDNACVLGFGYDVYCWGANADVLQAPGESLTTIAVGSRHACGARMSDGTTLCWGENDSGQLDAPAGRSFFRLGAFGALTCGADLAGMQCWGDRAFSVRSPSIRIGGEALAAGTMHTCTSRGNGSVKCWGDDTLGQRRIPGRRTHLLSANGDHTCGLGADGRLQCWGSAERDANVTPADAMRAVDAGQFNGCAVRSDGRGACWGWNVNAQNNVPDGAFRSIVTGLNHSCGLRDDGTLTCWGYGAEGQTTPPAGNFVAVEVGERHSCAIAADGAMHCWGMNSEGQATAPSGTGYRAFAAGAFHNCAIAGDGHLVCWGRNDVGQATPPTEGRFVSIAAGAAHTCAVRDNGARVCWGDNTAGQAPQPAIAPETLPQAVYDTDYRARMQLLGENYLADSPTFRFVEGDYPFDLEFDGYGILFGRINQAPTSYTFVIEASDENGFVARRQYTLESVLPPDTTPPLIQPVLNGSWLEQEWYTGDVALEWLVSDDESAVSSTAGCDAVTVTEDTAGVSFTCTATSEGGTAERTVTIRRDTVAPETVFDLVPSAVNYTSSFYSSANFAFSSPGTDLSGVSGFICSPTPDLFFSYPCQSPWTVGFLQWNQTYRLYVRAKDGHIS